MIEVEAVMWYWTPQGMRNQPHFPQSGMGMNRYVEASQVERLLEDAYRRGMNDAKEQAMDLVRRA